MKNRDMKISKLFKVDVTMLPVIIGLIITGIKIHVTSYGLNHETWYNWAVAHVALSLAFTILVYIHIRQHWAWYKNLLLPAKKPRIISILLTTVMLLELITGMALIAFVDGEGSSWGHIHWIGGLILTALATGHIIKRFKILLKGLRIM